MPLGHGQVESISNHFSSTYLFIQEYRNQGIQIPTFDEILDWFFNKQPNPNLLLKIEVKPNVPIESIYVLNKVRMQLIPIGTKAIS